MKDVRGRHFEQVAMQIRIIERSRMGCYCRVANANLRSTIFRHAWFEDVGFSEALAFTYQAGS